MKNLKTKKVKKEVVEKVKRTNDRTESILNTISTYILISGLAILPFFFIPAAKFSLPFSKMILFVFVVLVPTMLWLVDSMKKGLIEVPSGKLVLAAMSVPGAYFLASLFSSSQHVSFFGQGFETETFFAVLMLFVLMLLIPILFKSNEKLSKFYFGFLVTFVVVTIFQGLRLLFGANFLSFGGIFNETSSNLIGKWNDMGVFFGLSAVLSFSALEILKTDKLSKILLYVILGLSIVFSAIVNFTTVWVMLALLCLFFFAHKLLFGKPGKKRGDSWSISKFVSITSILVFIISAIFIIAGGFLGDMISNKLSLSQIEARPSWGTTFEIAKESSKNDILFGVGPNRFVNEWLMNKPEGINNTIFWNSNFNSGIGTIPSAITTTGLVGTISWILFLALFMLFGFRNILLTGKDEVLPKFIGTTSFLAAFCLWVFSFFYVPNISILALTFLFSGIFIASQASSGRITVFKVDFLKNKKTGFAAVFAIVVLLVGGVSLGYVYTKKYVSFVIFQSGVIAFNEDGDVTKAEDKLLSAIKLSENDAYYRALAQLDIVRLNQIISQENIEEDVLRNQFQSALGAAIANANHSTEINPNNYQNWVSLGQVYGSIVGLGIEGSYDSAVAAYNKALELNPHSPSLYLTLARLSAANNDNESARKMIAMALREKNNYTEAVFFLSQIEVADGNTEAAISSVEAAATISPNEPTIFFQLGLLRYSNKQFNEAVFALERAVSLSPTYSNAKYFLGLSYYEVGRLEDAITQFEDVQTLNPDNTEIQEILTRLKDGLEPLDNTAEAGNNGGLPIEE